MKKIIVLGLILLTTISMMIDVYAVSTFEMSLQSSKNELNKGEEFTVDVKISNIQLDKGIIAIGGRIEYDKDSLELVKLEGENEWARPSYNEDNGKFATDRDDYGTSDEVIFKIVFKVKEQSKENLTITLNEVAGSNGKDEVKLDNIKTNITVKNGTQNPDNENPDTNTSVSNTTADITNTNNVVNNTVNNISNNSQNVTNTTNSSNKTNTSNNALSNTNISDDIKEGILPKAGSNAMIFGTIGILIIIAGIFYIRIRIINSKATKNNIIK